MVVEIPKFSTAKQEISLKEIDNPIVQDMKKGQPRNQFGPIQWNQGALPQTYENPNKTTKFGSNVQQGDGDPLDCVDIGSKITQTGEIVDVKVLGALVMIDDGALDQKLIVAQKGDEMCKYNCVSEIETSGDKWLLPSIREWFRIYKQSDGIINKFENGEDQLNAAQTKDVIKECHHEWYNEIIKSKD